MLNSYIQRKYLIMISLAYFRIDGASNRKLDQLKKDVSFSLDMVCDSLNSELDFVDTGASNE